MNYYYTDAKNQTAGPVTLEALQTLIRDGVVKPDPMVIHEGGTQWQPLSAYSRPAAGAPAAIPSGAPTAAAAQFCAKCGTRLTGTSNFCPSCGAPSAGGHQAAAAAEKVKAASQDALAAFKILAFR